MERKIVGWIPCIMLEGSLVRDDDTKIKAEITSRSNLEPPIPTSWYEVEWTTLQTTGEKQAAAKCIVSKPEHYKDVSRLWTITRTQDEDLYLVTNAYKTLVIPHPQTAQFDQELNQAMARHMSYAYLLTFVLITGITPCDPFVLVPSTPMMSGLKDGDNEISMARLLMTGASTLPDNQVLKSPIVRVATERDGTRLFLYSYRTEASKLIQFAKQVLYFLPHWLQTDLPALKLDCRDADRAGRGNTQEGTSASIHSQASTPTQDTTHVATTHAMMKAPGEQDLVHIPRIEWENTTNMMAQILTKLNASDAKFDSILDAIATLPTFQLIQTSMGDATSTLTQIVTSSSASTQASQQVILSSLDVMTKSIDSARNTVTDLYHRDNRLNQNNTLPDGTTATNLDNTEVGTLDTLETPLPPSPTIARDTASTHQLSDSTCNRETNQRDITPPHTATLHSPPTPGQADTPDPTTESCQSLQLPDLARPMTDTCHGCGKIAANINQCDHCELPYHTECMLPSPGGTQYYCQDCASLKQPASELPPTQETVDPESSGLSVTSSSTSESEDNYVPNHPIRTRSGDQPNVATPSHATSQINLRPRGRKKS